MHHTKLLKSSHY